MGNIIKKICCIGAGYVGGPTMAVIAEKCPEIEVYVVDMNAERIKKWNDDDLSKLPVFEPGLSEVISKCRNKNLFFTTELKKNLASSDMVFISVNTPTKTRGVGAGQASDLKWIEASARQIAEYAQGHTIVIEKSTLPVKTAQTIKKILMEANQDNSPLKNNLKSFSILSNPEFLAEGTAISDLKNPDRVLIGGEDDKAINALISIYKKWVNKEKIITTDLWSSELSKLVANAFLAQRISSINSISALCEKTGADIKDVSIATGTDKRIGKYFLNAGPGFGGSCFKKDISNLVYICNYYGLAEVSSYWQKVIDINSWQKRRISKIIIEKLFNTLSGKKISVLGFSFKANTNDTRESPSIDICRDLMEEGANISIYDPKVKESQVSAALNIDTFNNSLGYKNFKFASSLNDCMKDSYAVIVLTEWEEFAHLDWDQIYSMMIKPAWIFDTRSIVDKAKVDKAGFNFWRIGS
ncbi:nucleotide sugar dehydrogenase [Prochlorococcus marinus]|uniref:nucleotide sugar dehydrogenase n=1 Tax=Prochlorococcus marinus TaxID=1219 RepID=UPI001AD99408|nr:nucleotide sugar dehydrogenase [Prochlorococcus marinus]MBO8204930.1 nucleotide sugar dehydrogenase [Prochlorococcus marinus CUG1415]MBW3044202.1 nucleotide sugar dehydrogenase [Prochlorococcus marinus str. MU1415]